MYYGIHIYYSDHALKDSDQRLFPYSKHRSKRIHKKLVKRFGGEYRRVPAIFKTPNGFIAHPALKAELELKLKGLH